MMEPFRRVRVYGGGDAEGRFWEIHTPNEGWQFRSASEAMDYLREIRYTEAEAIAYAEWEAALKGEPEAVEIDRAECMWKELRDAVGAES